MRPAPLLAAAAAGAGVLHAAPALMPLLPPLASALGVPRSLSEPHGVALTFDDGPHAEGTPAVLRLLADRGMTATFFLVGEQVRARPALAAEIAAAGHRIALHCDRHRNNLRLGRHAIAEDLRRGHAAIAEATGSEPALQRAPYGIYTPGALRAVREGGWRPWLWTRWGRDWDTRRSPAEIAARAAGGGLRGGDVILLHDGDDYSDPGSWRHTIAALPRVLDALEASGEPAVAVG